MSEIHNIKTSQLSSAISSSSGDTNGITKKRRRKVVKTCTFCRKRKLKCDHSKPMCDQCNKRSLSQCIYTNDFNFQLTADELFKGAPNMELLQRIKVLESMIDRTNSFNSPDTDASLSNFKNTTEVCGETITTLNNLKAIKLPKLKSLRILSVKDGVTTTFGPTSWRTILEMSGRVFKTEYSRIWDRINPEKKKWKIQHNIPTVLSEIRCLDSPMINFRNLSYLGVVCEELPTYDIILLCIDEFFQSQLHDLMGILDEERVKRDFQESILSIDPNTKKVRLHAPDGKNFFKIGIILTIIHFTYFKDHIPDVVERFLVSLMGVNTSKLNFVERAQFLFLAYISKVYIAQDCFDGALNSDLVCELCHVAITLGICDIDWWYEQQDPKVVGPKEPLVRLWQWVLYSDVSVSFDMGKPLTITDDYFDPKSLEDNDNISDSPMSPKGRRYRLMKRFLKVSRHCINSINGRTLDVDMLSLIDELVEFTDEVFLPMKCYTNVDMISVVDKYDFILLTTTIGMLINFHNLTLIISPKCSVKSKNGLGKFCLLGITICVNLIIFTYKDYLYYSKNSKPSKSYDVILKPSEPSLNMALLFSQSLFMRVLTETHSLLFFKLNAFEKGSIMPIDQPSEFEDKLESIRVNEDVQYSFKGFVKTFYKTIDVLFDPSFKELPALISKSYSLTMSLAMEKVSRALFERGLASREKVENSWRNEKIDFDTISQDIMNQFSTEIWDNYELQSQSVWTSAIPELYADFNWVPDM